MTIKQWAATERRLIILAMRRDMFEMEKDYDGYSDNELLLTRLRMLSNMAVPKLVEALRVPESELLQHPGFEKVATKMLNEITI